MPEDDLMERPIHLYYSARSELPKVFEKIGPLDPKKTLVVILFEDREKPIDTKDCTVKKLPINDGEVLMPSVQVAPPHVNKISGVRKAIAAHDRIIRSDGSQAIENGLTAMCKDLGIKKDTFSKVIFVCQSGLSRSPYATEVFDRIMFSETGERCCYIDDEKSCRVVYLNEELRKNVEKQYRRPRNTPDGPEARGTKPSNTPECPEARRTTQLQSHL